MNKCLNCQEETKNPKFCSRSCSAIYNNKRTPKRVCKRVCIDCGLPTKSWRSSRCKKHIDEYNKNKVSNITIGEYRNRLSVKEKHPSWLHSAIRNFARNSYGKKNSLCYNCGYNKHTEICHIIPIASFSDDTMICLVNSTDNLIELCPNCHWEFDHGLLRLNKKI